VQYLNNNLEQDHRAIKPRVRASQHFRSFWGAWRTIAGYEAIHMIRQRPGVRECVGEGRSTPSLHSRFVQRDGGLILLTLSPNFALTPNLQHYLFKSLKDVVHFYNKRNIAVGANGKEIAFDLRKGPPSGYTPLFPPPEVLDNVQNVTRVPPSQATSATRLRSKSLTPTSSSRALTKFH
jgi:hypothetical protein